MSLVGCIVAYKTSRYLRAVRIDEAISMVETYKSKQGKYPVFLWETGMKENGFYYYRYTDSTENYFSISYDTGIMGCNHHSYDSRTKQWEESFNY